MAFSGLVGFAFLNFVAVVGFKVENGKYKLN